MGNNNGIEVTEVRIRKIDGMMRAKAMASVVLNNSICINNIRVMESEKGMYIYFPSWKINGEFKDIVHPINQETRDKIQEAIIKEYQK